MEGRLGGFGNVEDDESRAVEVAEQAIEMYGKLKKNMDGSFLRWLLSSTNRKLWMSGFWSSEGRGTREG